MFQENLLLSVLFLVFAVSAAIQLFYYLWFYLAPVIYKPTETKAKVQPVSVIICARNEAENLRQFLPAILEQDYPDYEVIVVNDCSEDNSYEVLGSYLKKYPHLRVSNVNKDPQYTHNKKFAQFIGIKAAKNELLLFTDADCRPETAKWIPEGNRTFEQVYPLRIHGNRNSVSGDGYQRHSLYGSGTQPGLQAQLLLRKERIWLPYTYYFGR
jgi:glycosyltransferase involved in cell wall biosynthesis